MTKSLLTKQREAKEEAERQKFELKLKALKDQRDVLEMVPIDEAMKEAGILSDNYQQELLKIKYKLPTEYKASTIWADPNLTNKCIMYLPSVTEVGDEMETYYLEVEPCQKPGIIRTMRNVLKNWLLRLSEKL